MFDKNETGKQEVTETQVTKKLWINEAHHQQACHEFKLSALHGESQPYYPNIIFF